MPQWLAITLFVVVVLVVLAALWAASAPRAGAPPRLDLRESRTQVLSIAVLVASVLLIIALAGPFPSAMFVAVGFGVAALAAGLRWARRAPRP